MSSPFGKNCPRSDCTAKVVRATGDFANGDFYVRCEKGHRAHATRDKGGRLKLTQED